MMDVQEGKLFIWRVLVFRRIDDGVVRETRFHCHLFPLPDRIPAGRAALPEP
ncbi:MAG: hypothetical protein ACOX5Z_07645 [Desulfobulbus sp.]|jgi:hypothetical protein